MLRFFSSGSSVLQACFQIVKKAITRYLVFQDRSQPYFQIWSEADGHRGCIARHGLGGLELTSPNCELAPKQRPAHFVYGLHQMSLKRPSRPFPFSSTPRKPVRLRLIALPMNIERACLNCHGHYVELRHGSFCIRRTGAK